MESAQWNCFILKRSNITSNVKWLFFVQRPGKRPAFALCWKKAFRYYIKQIDSMSPCVWFSNRLQKTSKCGKNISDTLRFASCATFLFLPHFDVICDLLLNRRTATWDLFVKCKLGAFKWQMQRGRYQGKVTSSLEWPKLKWVCYWLRRTKRNQIKQNFHFKQ